LKTRIGTSNQKNEIGYLVIILLFSLILYGVFIFRTVFVVDDKVYFSLIDDAMISMRYARNLSNGYGLVWNIGEPPVEGFTNMGWTLYMAFLHTMPVSESRISLLVMITSAILLIGNALICFKLCKVIAPDSERSPLIATTITAFYYPLVFWSLRGMEVGLLIFLINLSVLLVIKFSRSKEKKWAWLLGLAMLMAIVVRFDAVLQISIIVVYSFFINKNKRSVGKVNSFLPILLFYIVGVVGILLFQYFYFGSIYPNTYYLKIVGASFYERLRIGSQVFVDYAIGDFLMLFLIIISGLLFYRDLRKKDIYLLIALFLIQCTYSLYIGGDYAEPLDTPQVDAANRFITQGMPLLIVVFSIIIDRFLNSLGLVSDSKKINRVQSRRSSGIIVIGISLASIIVMSGGPWFQWVINNAPLLDADIRRTNRGIHIRNYTDENAVIAVHAAGQIPYYSNRQAIDLLGKSDPVVAKGPPATSFRPGHNKWNYEYSIVTLKPDLIADEWGQLNEFLIDNPEYYRLENGIWVRSDSEHLNFQGLAQDDNY